MTELDVAIRGIMEDLGYTPPLTVQQAKEVIRMLPEHFTQAVIARRLNEYQSNFNEWLNDESNTKRQATGKRIITVIEDIFKCYGPNMPATFCQSSILYRCIADTLRGYTYRDLERMGENGMVSLAENEKQRAALQAFYVNIVMATELERISPANLMMREKLCSSKYTNKGHNIIPFDVFVEAHEGHGKAPIVDLSNNLLYDDDLPLLLRLVEKVQPSELILTGNRFFCNSNEYQDTFRRVIAKVKKFVVVTGQPLVSERNRSFFASLTVEEAGKLIWLGQLQLDDYSCTDTWMANSLSEEIKKRVVEAHKCYNDKK